NSILVSDLGTIWSNTAGPVVMGGGAAANFNVLTISNGAKFFSGAITIGNALGASNNTYNVGGGSSAVTVSNSGITIGGGSQGSSFNTMTVTNAFLFSGAVTNGNSGATALGAASSNLVRVLAGAT